jgi:hypothetical protein
LADQRITALTSLPKAGVAATDVLPIADISASQTKKVTAKDLVDAGLDLIDASSIDLDKLDQASTTKLGTTALADDAVTAAKLADDSSIAVETTAPTTDNFEGRGYFNSTSGNLQVFNGSTYQQVIAPTAGIGDLQVTTGKLADGAVTTAKVTALDTAAYADSSVTTAKIADGAVTAVKIATDSITATQVAPNAIGASELADNAVDTAAVVNLAVTAAKLSDGAVTTNKLGDLAVTDAKIASTTISYGKLNLADGSIPGAKIATDSIAAGQIAANAVGTSELANTSVTTAKVADLAITGAKIANDTITAAQIAPSAVGTSELANAAVTYAKIQNVSATDRLLGRSTAGAGTVEEIPLTAAGRALLDDADAATQRSTLGLGAVAVASAITAAELADDAVTAAKLANNSSVDLITALPVSGAFVGQIALNTDDSKAYIWNGSTWVNFKAAGSINTAVADNVDIISTTIATSGDQVTIGTSIDNSTAAAQFIAGPSGSAGAVSLRPIVGADLPTASASAKGGVIVNGNGLAMSDDTITIGNTVTPETVAYHVVRYGPQGLITAGRAITGADLPAATASVKGVVIPGTGLAVLGDGTLNHSNAVTGGSSAKVSFDAQGHITGGLSLEAADIPEIPATKLTSGTLSASLIGTNTITGNKLANSSITKFGGAGSTAGDVAFPNADFTGQYFFDSINGDLYLWDGNAWQAITITAGEIIFAGTYDASDNEVASVTTAGTAAGLTVGSALPAAADVNSRYYVVVSVGGTGTAPAPAVVLAAPDMLLSNGTAWQEIDVSTTVTAQVASNISFTPTGTIASNNVQTALVELDTEKLALAGGTVTGELLIGAAGSLVFEGSTADGNETTITVADPTADRTITFPNVTGNVVTTGDTGTVTSTMILEGTIVNADINASAAIALSKLATGALPTAITVASANIVDGTIVNADINASAGIVDTKLATISTAGKVSGTAITSGTIATSGELQITSAFPAIRLTESDGTSTHSQTMLVKDNNQFSIQTRSSTGVFVSNDYAVPADASGATDHIWRIAGTEKARLDSTGLTVVNDLTISDKIIHAGDTNTAIRFPAADTIAFETDGAERARIDSFGRLLVGTSSAVSVKGITAGLELHALATTNGAAASIARFNNDAGSAQLNFGKSRSGTLSPGTVVQNNDTLGDISFCGDDGTDINSQAARITCEVDGTPGADDMPGRLVFSTTADGASSPAEAMRIDSSKKVWVSDSFSFAGSFVSTSRLKAYTNSNSNTDAVAIECAANSAATRHHITFTNSNGAVGSISTNASATAYNTSSDYRLKENVTPLNGAIARLSQLPVYRFNFIADPDTLVDGFIAHEAAAIVPECVTGEKDEEDENGNPVYQGIDQSKIVPLLTAALQEAIAKINALETRIAALES